MDFQKYINHDQNAHLLPPSNNKKHDIKPRVIKFVGNMQENIKELLQNINCNCGSRKQFYNILLVFANKIQKLRKQREHYKTTLKQYLLAMNNNSIKGSHQPVQKSIKRNSQKKSKTTHKKQDSQQQSTKFYQNNIIKINDKENQTPLKKVTNLFLKEKSKTVCLNEKLHDKLQNKENHQTRNHLTAVKKSIDQQLLVKQFNTLDKRMSDFYSLNKLQETHQEIENNHDSDGSFSLNLSSFQETDTLKKQPNQQPTKQVSNIMNQTNLLDSDDEELPSFKTPCKKQTSEQLPQSQVDKLKLLKQSTVFQDILITLSNQQHSNNPQMKKSSRNDKTSSKKKINLQQSSSNKKSVKKSDKINDKQNINAEICLKKYNITIEKLEQFIENKECLKQMQKDQNYDLNLKNFKSLSTNLFKSKDQTNEYESVRKTMRQPMRPLQERKFNFN